MFTYQSFMRLLFVRELPAAWVADSFLSPLSFNHNGWECVLLSLKMSFYQLSFVIFHLIGLIST